MPSITPLKSYSLKVELEPDPTDTYWVGLKLWQNWDTPEPQLIVERQLRLDNLYEQIQTIVDNTLRRVVNQLSSNLREQRKNAKDRT